jgi:hypothetical protein
MVEHEAKELRGGLKMKDRHKKNRIKLLKVNVNNGMFITNGEIV